jgi:hypothetical protein
MYYVNRRYYWHRKCDRELLINSRFVVVLVVWTVYALSAIPLTLSVPLNFASNRRETHSFVPNAVFIEYLLGERIILYHLSLGANNQRDFKYCITGYVSQSDIYIYSCMH